MIQNRGPTRPLGLPACHRHRPRFLGLAYDRQARPTPQPGQAGRLKHQAAWPVYILYKYSFFFNIHFFKQIEDNASDREKYRIMFCFHGDWSRGWIIFSSNRRVPLLYLFTLHVLISLYFLLLIVVKIFLIDYCWDIYFWLQKSLLFLLNLCVSISIVFLREMGDVDLSSSVSIDDPSPRSKVKQTACFYSIIVMVKVCAWHPSSQYSKNCLALYFTKWNLSYVKHDCIS